MTGNAILSILGRTIGKAIIRHQDSELSRQKRRCQIELTTTLERDEESFKRSVAAGNWGENDGDFVCKETKNSTVYHRLTSDA